MVPTIFVLPKRLPICRESSEGFTEGNFRTYNIDAIKNDILMTLPIGKDAKHELTKEYLRGYYFRRLETFAAVFINENKERANYCPFRRFDEK